MHKHFKLKGFFKIEIVDAETGLVETTLAEKQNLILNQGKDFVAQRTFVENILYCAVGAGTTSPLPSDVGLQAEVMRTGNIETNIAVPCQTTLASNVISFTKTFAFPVSVSPTTIGEIGWSWTPTAGNNLFSKSIIANQQGVPGPVTISPSKYLRVYYTLQVTIGPAGAVSFGASIAGWPTSTGQASMQYIGLRSITANGSLSYVDAGLACNEPSGTSEIFIGTSSAALAAFGSSTNRSAGTNYTNGAANNYKGNGVLWKTASFGKNNAASATLRSMGVGIVGSSYITSGYVCLLDSNQNKDTTYLLPLRFIYTWA